MNLFKILAVAVFLLGFSSDLIGQRTRSQTRIWLLKADAGFREQLIKTDSVLIDSVIAYSNEYGSDTITGFLNRTYGLPENADGYAYGFSGEIRGLMVKELLKKGQHMPVVLENLLIKELYPPSQFNEYADYILDYPALYILVRDSSTTFPLLRSYVISNQPVLPEFTKKEKNFNLAYKRFLYLFLGSFPAGANELLPEKYRAYLNSLKLSSKEYYAIRSKLSFPEF